jgi:lauroyl/myristoyl acyltransferase
MHFMKMTIIGVYVCEHSQKCMQFSMDKSERHINFDWILIENRVRKMKHLMDMTIVHFALNTLQNNDKLIV